jgi:hypothetical protein
MHYNKQIIKINSNVIYIFYNIFSILLIWCSFTTLNIKYWCSVGGNLSDISGSGLLYLKLELICCLCLHLCY